MENHPIPQDVTGFQFKLVGNMTLKQFGYVGVGVVLTVIFWYAPLAWYIKFLTVPTFASIGISLAFIPIGGRPLDLMASFFLKAIIKPNQFVYQKVGGSLSFMDLNLQPVVSQPVAKQVSVKDTSPATKKEQELYSYLYDVPADSHNPLDQRENQLVNNLFSRNEPASTIQPSS